ncbi:MAG: trypsin-like peptidase domain-containing protein [Clostridiaceae bacterium]|nr:trypsin-like peptidase domain-containing protein [Clostridiaceae bacterium]
MKNDYGENNRYAFQVEGFEQPAQEPHEITVPQAAESAPVVDQKYVKKMLTRVVALSVALALLLGGGLGVLLNRFVFTENGHEDSAQMAESDGTDAPQETGDTQLPPAAPNTQDTNQGISNLLYTESNNTSPMSTADVVASVEDSVVAITVEIENTTTYMYQNYKYTSEAKGSGVIVSPDGYIVTNNHVIADATKVYVTLSNGQSYDATVIGADDATDLGLIKIEAKDLLAAKFGDSEGIRKGDAAIIIGNPLGYLDGSVSAGVISATGRTLNFSDGTTLHNLIQTDAAVNPGNSGGGLFDSYGALIGVVCAKTSSTEVEGLGFAIPVSTVRTVIQDLKDYGYVTGRPALGINAIEVNDAYTAMYNKLPRLGVYVTGFISSEAENGSELKIGDCIVSINGVEVTTTSEILAAIYPLSVGDEVEVVVYRNSELVTVKTTLVEQDENY